MSRTPERPALSGVGGLPFPDLQTALAHQRAHYDLTFRPQLPIGDGEAAGMLAEVLPATLDLVAHPGFGVKLRHMIEDGAIARSFGSGIDGTTVLELTRDFIDGLEPRESSAGLRVSLAGPLTILQSLRDEWSRPLFSEAALHAPVSDWCARLAGTLASMTPAGSTIILDEPVLGLPGPRDAVDAVVAVLAPVIAAIREHDREVGLHCCSEPPFPILAQLALDELSIDALRYASEIIGAADQLAAFVADGGRLALGLVAPMPLDDVQPEPELLLDALVLSGQVKRESLIDALVLTPTCGTMLCPEEREIEIVHELEALRDRLLAWKEEAA